MHSPRRMDTEETRESLLEGVHLRENDLDPQRGLHFVGKVFRFAAGAVVLLALIQFVAWWLNPPPGHIGIGVLLGDTVRLIIFASLLIAVGEFATLMIKTHYDMRAARILLTRQTYMIRQAGLVQGWLPVPGDDDLDRRSEPGTEQAEPNA